MTGGALSRAEAKQIVDEVLGRPKAADSERAPVVGIEEWGTSPEAQAAQAAFIELAGKGS